MGYFGDYYKRNRNIIPLYNFVKNDKDLKLLICGKSDIDLNEENNIIIKERQPIEKIREFEKKTDILICICNNSGTQIPGKVYHYSATNKPILIILDGENQEELKQYFNKFNRYILCYNNEESIKEGVKKISSNTMNTPCKKLSSKNIAKEFINIINEK